MFFSASLALSAPLRFDLIVQSCQPAAAEGGAHVPKVKIDASLFDRLKKVAEIAGYSSTEEFIVHIIEKELAKVEAENDEEVADRLKGLGYLE